MKCMSCSEEINAKFKHAIEANTCPFCGSVIMAEELKNLLTELRSVMDKLLGYPEELKDFLKNNYELIKSSELQPTFRVGTKLPKTVPESSINDEGVQVTGEALLEQEQVNSIMDRAGASKINGRTNHLKNLVNQIKSGKVSSEDVAQLPDEYLDELDRQEINELQSAFVGNSSFGSLDSSMLNSELGGGDEDVPAHVLAFAGKKGGISGNEARDLARLQNMVKKSQSGGGKINRSQ